MGGGAEKILADTVRNLDPEKYEVTIFPYADYHIKAEQVPEYVTVLPGMLDITRAGKPEKAMKHLDGYGRIDCYLDHDAAGRRTLKTLKGHYGERVCDRSNLYDGCKDLNEHLQLTTKKKK